MKIILNNHQNKKTWGLSQNNAYFTFEVSSTTNNNYDRTIEIHFIWFTTTEFCILVGQLIGSLCQSSENLNNWKFFLQQMQKIVCHYSCTVTQLQNSIAMCTSKRSWYRENGTRGYYCNSMTYANVLQKLILTDYTRYTTC